MARRAEADAVQRLPIVFEAGGRKICLTMGGDWVWSCSVDGAPVPGRYLTQVEAWEAGVREADRLDRAADGAGR